MRATREDPKLDSDLVIVGAGLAGWTAARRAQQLGLGSVVLDKHTVGPGWGNSRVSGGVFHAAYRTAQQPPGVLYDELMGKTQGYARPELVRVWADNVWRVVEFLRAEGGQFENVGDEEYKQNVLHPPMLRPEQRLLHNVLASAGPCNSPSRPSRLGCEFSGKGPDNLLTAMWSRYVEQGGIFHPRRRAVELVMEGRTVCGVRAQTDHGEEFYVGKSVLLCDGGFQANPELVARYITPAYKLRGIFSGTGDALQMGLAVGAKTVNLEWFYGHILARDPLCSDDLAPEFGLGGLLRIGICVDGYGRRFADEALGDEVMADRIAKSSTPGGCWIVFDDEAWRSEAAAYGELSFNPNLVTRGGGTVLSALSAEELADQAGLPRFEFAATLDEFNAHTRHISSITVPRTGSSRPIDVRPLHAIPAIAGITLAMGGLLVNEFAQVLDEGECAINGLYAAGGSMGGLQGGPGFGYSGGLSEAAVFGLLAAEHIASAGPGSRHQLCINNPPPRASREPVGRARRLRTRAADEPDVDNSLGAPLGLADEPRILADDMCFPEGPRWDGKRFIVSDVHAHRVVAIDTSGRLTVIAELGDRPSGLGFLPDGSLLVVGMLDRRLWRIEGDGHLSEHADLSSVCSDFINDMVVDEAGRAYVGCRSGKPGPTPDSIILVQPDGHCSVAAQGVRSPNGSVITPDGRSLIVAETHIGRLTRFTINRDGSLSDRQVYADVPGYTFDGICLDENGNVWAGAGDNGLVQVGPDGQLVAQRPPWDYHVIACVFGGPQRRHLLVTTAAVTSENFQRLGKNRELDIESTSRGRLALFELDIAGAGIP